MKPQLFAKKNTGAFRKEYEGDRLRKVLGIWLLIALGVGAVLNRNNIIGGFRFVVLERFLSYVIDLPNKEKLILNRYSMLKPRSPAAEKTFGLDTSTTLV